MVSHLGLAGLCTFLDLMGSFDSSWSFLEQRVQPPCWTPSGTTPPDLWTPGCPQSSSSSSSSSSLQLGSQLRESSVAHQRNKGQDSLAAAWQSGISAEGNVSWEVSFSVPRGTPSTPQDGCGQPTGSDAKQGAANICSQLLWCPIAVPVFPQARGCAMRGDGCPGVGQGLRMATCHPTPAATRIFAAAAASTMVESVCALKILLLWDRG